MAVHEEDILFDLKDYFDANLDTYLTAIETEKADGVELTDIKRYEVGDSDVYKLQQYPAGLLFPDEIAYENLSTSQKLLKMRVVITVALRGGKTENLTLKILRTAAAFRECVNADKTCGGAVDRAMYNNVVFYARPPGIEDKMVCDLIIDTEKCIVW